MNWSFAPQEHSQRYWDVNVKGSRYLLEAMAAHGCHTLLFSSSVTLYGYYPEAGPEPETAPILPIIPYGQTKDAVDADAARLTRQCPGRLADRLLALFNPVSAHPLGHMGKTRWASPTTSSPL